ncbi:DNA polymerase [Halalkalicoccus paucihalophilus]|uniref:DNA-directed DNA polymerase n=1 Tax=Halalkalicoccus paucihalophilus TaxID=1008153 RepID=A0A151A994_9EURY|nr:type B DNA-directed DNA polymerase [Halalkalicoccus paucihalophilus]KYH24251.1 DNA polymerase [Halalkalicoccus paucihalophilus]
MVYKIDFLKDVYEWSITPGGAEYERVTDYTPTIYATYDGRTEDGLSNIRERLEYYPTVVSMVIEQWRRGFRHEHEPVLRIDVRGLADVPSLASRIRRLSEPGEYKLYNVDLSREFRYCLERGRDPTPTRVPVTLAIDVAPPELVNPPLTELTLDDETVTGSPEAILHAIQRRLGQVDPDVLVFSSGEILPTLSEMADQHEVDLRLGRRPGWEQLAERSTYESYGSVGHSPARYNVPGRVIIDRSNTFFHFQSGLDGCLDMVERSGKPLQELGWASIGNVLTAIQIREARDRGVLVPWNSWRHEFFKPLSTLHDADRGGYTFSPEVGFHEDVHELDFSSLYPNIICQFNISPEMIRCDCHADRADVPGLGYSICDERGDLPDVLQPLIDARDTMKQEIRESDDEERVAVLKSRADAIKWILVSCFGYQGFSNAKFGRIECHEAINAYAREILLDTKETFEANGWHLLHGIVDSLWVTAIEGEDQTPLSELAAVISDRVGIRLEYEAAFEWLALVPLRDSDEGALTKYFGKVASEAGDEPEYKYRGVECRQRSTPDWITNAQQELIETLDQSRSPEAVCARLQRQLAELHAGRVDPQALAIDNRASKHTEEYTRATRTVAALQRAQDEGLDPQPGQNVSYVVVDDSKCSRDRVQLAHESPQQYDVEFYADLLCRAAESVCSPLGWQRSDIETYLSDHQDSSLAAFQN